MVEPVSIILAAATIISFLSTGLNWLKSVMNTDSSVPVPLSIATQTSQPAVVYSSVNDDTARIEYENYKEKKKALSSYESNDHRSSSSNSSSAILVILCITVILGIMGFIIYQKRNKLKENQLKYRSIESPPSPRTTQTDLNSIII